MSESNETRNGGLDGSGSAHDHPDVSPHVMGEPDRNLVVHQFQDTNGVVGVGFTVLDTLARSPRTEIREPNIWPSLPRPSNITDSLAQGGFPVMVGAETVEASSNAESTADPSREPSAESFDGLVDQARIAGGTIFFISLVDDEVALKASDRALASLVSVPLSEIPLDERECAICYEPLVDNPIHPARPHPQQVPSLRSEEDARQNSESARLREFGVFGLSSGDEVHAPLRMPDCRHVFGASCLHAWLKTAASCPLCRAKLQTAIEERHPEFQGTHHMHLFNQDLHPEILARIDAARRDELDQGLDQSLAHYMELIRRAQQAPPRTFAEIHEQHESHRRVIRDIIEAFSSHRARLRELGNEAHDAMHGASATGNPSQSTPIVSRASPRPQFVFAPYVPPAQETLLHPPVLNVPIPRAPSASQMTSERQILEHRVVFNSIPLDAHPPPRNFSPDTFLPQFLPPSRLPAMNERTVPFGQFYITHYLLPDGTDLERRAVSVIRRPEPGDSSGSGMNDEDNATDSGAEGHPPSADTDSNTSTANFEHQTGGAADSSPHAEFRRQRPTSSARAQMTPLIRNLQPGRSYRTLIRTRTRLQYDLETARDLNPQQRSEIHRVIQLARGVITPESRHVVPTVRPGPQAHEPFLDTHGGGTVTASLDISPVPPANTPIEHIPEPAARGSEMAPRNFEEPALHGPHAQESLARGSSRSKEGSRLPDETRDDIQRVSPSRGAPSVRGFRTNRREHPYGQRR